MLSHRFQERILCLLIWLGVGLIHFHSPVAIISDSLWNLYTSVSIIQSGDTDLNEFEAALRDHDFHAIHEHEGRYYNFFSVGPSVVALPFVSLALKLPGGLLFFNEHGYDYRSPHQNYDVFVAANLLAITAVFVYLIARESLGRWPAVFAVLLFAFCTPAWSTVSRSQWTHGPVLLSFALMLWLMLRSRKTPWLIALVAAPLAVTFVCRPNNILAVLLFSAYVLWQHRRYFPAFVACGLLVAAPWLLHTYLVFGDPIPVYHGPWRMSGEFEIDPWNAFAANMVSPSRSLWIYCPLYFFSIYGFWRSWRSDEQRPLHLTLGIILILHTIAFARYVQWWAGHSYGPRGYADYSVFFVFWLLPVLRELFERTHRAAFVAAFALCVAWSFFVHFRGAVHDEVHLWSLRPVDVDQAPNQRIWDWSDPQFLRGLGPFREDAGVD